MNERKMERKKKKEKRKKTGKKNKKTIKGIKKTISFFLSQVTCSVRKLLPVQPEARN